MAERRDRGGKLMGDAVPLGHGRIAVGLEGRDGAGRGFAEAS